MAATHTTVSIDAQTLAVISGVIVPILVGVLTKINASSGLKAILNALLCAVGGWLAVVIPGQPYDLRDVVIGITMTWVISVATYYGLLKPAGTAEFIQQKTGKFGLGAGPE